MARDEIGTNKTVYVIRKADNYHAVVRMGRGTIIVPSAGNLEKAPHVNLGSGIITLTPLGWVLQRIISDSAYGRSEPVPSPH